MRSWVLFCLMMTVLLSWSCEDPNTLTVARSFSGNNLQTAYLDTFTIVTSTVQLDSVLTNNSGTVLLGRYQDERLGSISASSYINLSYTSIFQPPSGPQYTFDSIALILPFNKYYVGDTTKAMKINVYQLSSPMNLRVLPNTPEQKLSVFANGYGFYNQSKINQFSTPICSATANFFPHQDSVYIRLPDAFGANWFRLAQIDSAQLFTNSSAFAGSYFYGLHIDVDPSSVGSVVGFKTNKVKLRLYYSQASGSDVPTSSHEDFTYYSAQFNNIQADRTGTDIEGIKKYSPVSSFLTSETSYVQSGTGLVTLLQFPSLQGFFSTNTGVILNAAYLEVFPLQGSYSKNYAPPSPLQLYVTDNSYIPYNTVSGGSASITYDYEYGINTFYSYPLFSYIYPIVRSNVNSFPPMILGPSGNQGSSVSRVYVGNQFHPNTKIKLVIYYSYVVP